MKITYNVFSIAATEKGKAVFLDTLHCTLLEDATFDLTLVPNKCRTNLSDNELLVHLQIVVDAACNVDAARHINWDAEYATPLTSRICLALSADARQMATLVIDKNGGKLSDARFHFLLYPYSYM